jgi:hypothetical protein
LTSQLLYWQSQFGEAQAKEMKVKQAQLAKAKAEPDINPNLIAVGNRVITKQKPKEDEIPDIEWWYASFSLHSFGLHPTTLWPLVSSFSWWWCNFATVISISCGKFLP